MCVLTMSFWNGTNQAKQCLSKTEKTLIATMKKTLETLEKGLQDKKMSHCPPGWIEFKSHCYSFNSPRIDWDAAEFECRRSGGYLVKIESSSENKFIQSQAKAKSLSYPWIGLRKYGGQWLWVVDIRKPSFLGWITGSKAPNGGANDCAHLHNSYQFRWNDQGSKAKYSYICERSVSGRCMPYSILNSK